MMYANSSTGTASVKISIRLVPSPLGAPADGIAVLLAFISRLSYPALTRSPRDQGLRMGLCTEGKVDRAQSDDSGVPLGGAGHRDLCM